MPNRRTFIRDIGKASLGLAGALHLGPELMASVRAANQRYRHLGPEQLAREEDYWATIQQAYTASPNIINLNNGGVSPQPRVVQDKEDHYIRLSNEAPAYYMWRTLDQGRIGVKRELARLAGCDPDEVAIVRNATEALENLLFGFDLKAGDEILATEHDYPNMMLAMKQRERREGIVLRTVPVPVPLADPSVLVDAYRKAITSRTRLILVSHMVFLTGQVLPVRDICRLGRERGIPVVVDGAHSFAHIDFKLADLECDFFGTSLHKWLCAPFGTGMLYVRKERIPEVWSLFGSDEANAGIMEKFEHQGTRSFPAEMAIGEALRFHNAIGSTRKTARLRYLTDYWVGQLKGNQKVRFNTAFGEGNYGALCNVAIDGYEPDAIVKHFWDNYRIFTVAINTANVQGVRITPHLYTRLSDLDLLVRAIKELQ